MYFCGNNLFGIYPVVPSKDVISVPEQIDQSVITSLVNLKKGSEIKVKLKTSAQCVCTWSTLYILENGQLLCFGFYDGKPKQIAFVTEYGHIQDIAVSNDKLLILDAKGNIHRSKSGKDISLECEEKHFIKLECSEYHTFAISENKSLYEIKMQNTSDALSLVEDPLCRAVQSVSCGKEHVLILDTAGRVLSFGLGSRGQLGQGSIMKSSSPQVIEALEGIEIKDVSAGGWHSACLSCQGDIYMFGWNESGQLALPCKELAIQQKTELKESTKEEPTQVNGEQENIFISIQNIPCVIDMPGDLPVGFVSCGNRHTAALAENGLLFTWGWNEYGQLGHGNLTSCDRPRKVSFMSNKNLIVETVTCGDWSTILASNHGELAL